MNNSYKLKLRFMYTVLTFIVLILTKGLDYFREPTKLGLTLTTSIKNLQSDILNEMEEI